jgi:putative phosphonate transport system ATP-binding protein
LQKSKKLSGKIEMKKVLEVKNLSKIYNTGCSRCFDSTGDEFNNNICPYCGSIVAVNNVSFELFAGEILGIMGESGSGKSTVIKMLFFDEMPTAGEAIFFDNKTQIKLFDINSAKQRWIKNHKFGVVYQNPHIGLNFNFSAGGNIAERLLMSDILSFSKIRKKAKELLNRTEVSVDRMDESPAKFSGGMQQRVQIAKALSTDPSVLFLDEVTTGLDLSVQAKILDLILEIQHEIKTSMIVVTHDLGVIRLLTDRTIVMRNGKIIEAGLTDQILEDPQHKYTQQLVSSIL